MDRNTTLRVASLIGIAGNAVLSLLKIAIGLVSGSLAVLGDGLDSLTDIFISIITLAVSVIISHPPDREHPYGHFRAETIATSILAFIMFFIGGQFALSTIAVLMHNDPISMPEKLAIVVTLFSIIGKILLFWSQYALGKKAGSAMLMANSKNMLNDVIISSSVLVGLVCAFVFNMPVIDKILAILIGVWIMIAAVRIFIGTVTELMEGEVNKELYDLLFDVVGKTDGVSKPHRVRIRKLGVQYAIDMDVEVDGDLTVTHAHDLVKVLEDRVRNSIPNIYDIVVHMEPSENHESEEKYGLSESNIR